MRVHNITDKLGGFFLHFPYVLDNYPFVMLDIRATKKYQIINRYFFTFNAVQNERIEFSYMPFIIFIKCGERPVHES